MNASCESKDNIDKLKKCFEKNSEDEWYKLFIMKEKLELLNESNKIWYPLTYINNEDKRIVKFIASE